METLEIKEPKNKEQEKYIDLSQYENIPALDRALAEPSGPAFDNMEDLIKYVHNNWDD